MHLSLAFNPSHLEIVNPVVEGSVRARQERRADHLGARVLAVQVHGDAAFAGQGVVMETLNLAQTRGYGTGGTVHIIINNQIGFTTSDPRDTRSTLYCSDVVKMIEAPVLHVNGDDPEAVVLATQIAMDFRTEFRKDIVIDIICFRRLGHNEQDTPAVTQPLMYKKIGAHPGTRKLYADKLVTQGVMAADEPEAMVRSVRQALDEGHQTVDPTLTNFKSKYAVDWAPFLNRKWTDNADTAVPLGELRRLAQRLTAIPENFRLHPLVEKVITDRRAMGEGKLPLDWGMGEHLAFASLVASGYAVRITGQDSGRGTFSHRHAVLHDQNRERWSEGTFIPLQNVTDQQAPFVVIDSVLSEEAVLGFEYGYSTAEPNSLVIWEAQFGDFVNGAQVVIDQFISSGEVKWGRQSGLVLMLPHGYEGQGPEHSSARIERFLQLGADNNMQVVQPTTAAQIFHLLRRQMIRPFRKPLVIMTPKSLLRSKDATSPLEELARGEFKTVIGGHGSCRPGQGQAPHRLQRQGVLRPAPRSRRAGAGECGPGPHRAVVSLPAQGAGGRVQALSQRGGNRVGAGRAAEPGVLVVRPASHAGEHERGAKARLRRPTRIRIARRWLLRQARGTAKDADRYSVRKVQGTGSQQVNPLSEPRPKARRPAPSYLRTYVEIKADHVHR